MRILGHTRLFQAAVVAAGIVAFSTCDALAWSRGSRGSSGSYGSASSGSSGSSSYGSASSGSYGSASSGGSASAGSASAGSRGGLFARWHARKAARAASSGSSASYASSGSSSYGSSGSSASYGSAGSYGSTSYYAPVESGTVEMYDSAPVEAPAEVSPTAPAPPQASIRVNVPADAKVFVNDRATTSTGESRHFVSRGLRAGRTYAYQLRIEYQRDGETVVENKLVRLTPGATAEFTFGSGEQVAEQPAAADTKLTVRVPAGAKVTLAGAATQQTGEVRTYVSTNLTPGQKWDGYAVRVELQRDGQTLVEEKVLDIEGGQTYDLAFDFADDAPAKIASIN